MLPPPPQPQLTPLVRHRLKERFPRLDDADLPLFELSDDELVKRIARRTHRAQAGVRQTLEEIGAIVPARPAPRSRRRAVRDESPVEESFGSGVPDDTAQSGAMSLGSGW